MNHNKSNIPAAAERTLRFLLPANEFTALSGDFEELYYNIHISNGRLRAVLWIWVQILKSVPGFISDYLFRSFSMLRNYLKISCRNIIKHKIYSAINILGLSVGLACCIMIFLFVEDELSFDRFHKNADSIYSVIGSQAIFDGTGRGATITMGPAMEEFFPEIKYAVRRYNMLRAEVRFGKNVFIENPVFTDSEFFQVFSFPLIKGSPESVLQPKNSVVMTKSTAEKYFGEADPVGETLTMTFGQRNLEFTVTGISGNIPENSSISFGMLINISCLSQLRDNRYLTNWNMWDTHIYVLLNEGAAPENVDKRFPAFINKHFAGTIEDFKSSGRWDGNGDAVSYRLQNIKDMHFSPEITGTYAAREVKSSFILTGIALLVLTVACINFINISIGGASARSLEIGLRKVLGADRKQLVRQFWSESLIMTAASMAAGIVIASVLLPVFNDYAGKNLNMASLAAFKNIFTIFCLITAVGIISGSFPALVLSRFRPVDIFKGKLKFGGSSIFTRSLVVFQFSLSIFLIISTLVMTKQIQYLSSYNPGFDKEGVLVINSQEGDFEKSEAFLRMFRNRVSGYSGIKSISGSRYSFNMGLGYSPYYLNGERIHININRVYYDYLKTLGIKLAEGRDFSEEITSDVSAVIVNRKLLEKLDLESPLEKNLELRGLGSYKIIGIVEDFNFQTLQEDIEPMAYGLMPGLHFFNYKYILVRVSPEDISGTLEFIKKTWMEIQPEKPFEYSFLEEDFSAAYNRQNRWNSIIRYSSFLAIFVTCIGIFGLTSITVSRLFKEIGIRKVLGATVPQIVSLVSKEFVILVLIANAVTWPVAWYIMYNWLGNYAYKTDVGLLTFILSGTLAVIIAVLAVSFQAVKAAQANPVDSIKCE